MDIAEIIGMLIALFAVLYSFGTILRGGKKSKPEEKNKLDKEIEEYLKELEGEDEEATVYKVEEPQPVPPSPPPKEKYFLEHQKEKFAFHATLEEYKTKTAIEERKLSIGLHSPDELVSAKMQTFGEEGVILKKKKDAPINRLLQKIPHKKVLVVASEIIQPPLSLRKR